MTEQINSLTPKNTNITYEMLKFSYSPDNPPALAELESKLFAVHTSTELPKNGIMI